MEMVGGPNVQTHPNQRNRKHTPSNSNYDHCSSSCQHQAPIQQTLLAEAGNMRPLRGACLFVPSLSNHSLLRSKPPPSSFNLFAHEVDLSTLSSWSSVMSAPPAVTIPPISSIAQTALTSVHVPPTSSTFDNGSFGSLGSLGTFSQSTSLSSQLSTLGNVAKYWKDWNWDSQFWEPIYLSTLAGASTCVGASVAFLVPRVDSIPDYWEGKGCLDDDDGVGAKENRAVAAVGPGLLSFSLALAGAVMITVCVISILPESLSIEVNTMNTQDIDNGLVFNTMNIFGIVISMQVLLQRSIGFVVGWGVYALISQGLTMLPEQDELGVLLGNNDVAGKPEALSNQSNAAIQNSREGDLSSRLLSGGRMGYPTLISNFSTPALQYSSADPFLTPSNILSEPRTKPTTSSDIYRNNKNYNNDNLQEKVQSTPKKSPWRLTLLLFLSLLLHNFPEGLAVAFSAASSSNLHTSQLSSADSSMIDAQSSSPSSLASIVTLSIALHNIPEGIAIAIPCMAARPNQPWLAFWLASLSGLAEPLGAFFALMLLHLRGVQQQMMDNGGCTGGLSGGEGDLFENTRNSLGNTLANGQDMGDALAFVAGIMMAVAICELIPEANRQRKECEDSSLFVWGIAIGVAVMVATELYLGG